MRRSLGVLAYHGRVEQHELDQTQIDEKRQLAKGQHVKRMVELPVTEFVCENSFDFLRRVLIQQIVIQNNVLCQERKAVEEGVTVVRESICMLLYA